jgi:leucyl aminopeptidase
MGALLGRWRRAPCARARVAVMQWQGGKEKRAKPLAFVGKGVVFDTGGISIKPAAGMEDMKGDMGGAAAVTRPHARARRSARRKVNAIGILGLVENMPDGNAQRPGDIVVIHVRPDRSKIINTDAEGRLVLCRCALVLQRMTFKPRFMINLATLTGAVMVALGSHHRRPVLQRRQAFRRGSPPPASQDEPSEKIWRLPLGRESYDKLMDSKFADVKNTGGRWGGAMHGRAAFLNRFIKKDVPWAHLDIAGTAMDAPKNEISTSWASGWGVQLLDELVRANYES